LSSATKLVSHFGEGKTSGRWCSSAGDYRPLLILDDRSGPMLRAGTNAGLRFEEEQLVIPFHLKEFAE
jgi:hypothetical protein